MRKNELLPCPFCGDEVSFCNECGYRYCKVITCKKCGDFILNGRGKLDAFKKWNTRKKARK